MITCPWCNTTYQDFQSSCGRCGGPLPPPPGDDPGPAPPPAPRQLPEGFARRLLFTDNVIIIPGLIFAGVGLPFLISFPIISLTTGEALFAIIGGGLGGLFVLMGSIFTAIGTRNTQRKLQAFQQGTATTGEIAEIYRDRSIQVNGRSPWAVIYTFAVDGRQYEGTTRTWDRSIQQREPGQPLHVLYGPADPEQNTIYPPLK